MSEIRGLTDSVVWAIYHDMRGIYESATSASFMSKHAFAQIRTNFVVGTTSFVGGATKFVRGATSFVRPATSYVAERTKLVGGTTKLVATRTNHVAAPTNHVAERTKFVGGTTKPVLGFIGPKNTLLQRGQKFFERNCISSV